MSTLAQLLQPMKCECLSLADDTETLGDASRASAVGVQLLRDGCGTLSHSGHSSAGGDEALWGDSQSMAFSGEFEGFCCHLTSRAGNVAENLTEKNLKDETLMDNKSGKNNG